MYPMSYARTCKCAKIPNTNNGSLIAQLPRRKKKEMSGNQDDPDTVTDEDTDKSEPQTAKLQPFHEETHSKAEPSQPMQKVPPIHGQEAPEVHEQLAGKGSG